MPARKHGHIETNGVKMHYVEQGEGPLVVLLHGFPECWYSWRHQLDALANAGFRAVAPDQRGYGGTDKPIEIEAYDQVCLAGDVAGLIEALGAENAMVVGHDWGAPVAWHTALLHPERARSVVGMCIPYGGRPRTSPLAKMKQIFGDMFFYMLYFQEPGIAEAELEADVRRTIRRIQMTWSGNAPEGLFSTPKPPSAKFLDGSKDLPNPLPAWVTEADIDFYVAEFEKSGFRGPLNWYRNFDRTFARTEALADAKVTQPGLFIAGEKDPALIMSQKPLSRMPDYVPELEDTVIIDAVGHWVQQEAASEVSQRLVEFARKTSPKP